MPPDRWFDRAAWAEGLGRARRALAMIWRSSPRWSTVGAAMIAFQAGVTIASLYLLKLIVDAVSAGLAAEGGGGSMGGVLLLVLLAGGVALVGVVARVLASMASEAQSYHVTDHMLERLHQKSLEVDYGYYEDPRFYDTLHRAQEEAPVRPTRLLGNLTSAVQSGITLVGVIGLLVAVHWLLALVIVVAVLPALAARVAHSRRMYHWQRKRSDTERRAYYFGWLIGNAQHAREMRVLDLGRELLGRFRDLRSLLRGEKMALAKARNLADAGSQVVATVVVFGSLAFIVYQTFNGVLTIGDMVMYFGAVQRGQSLLQSLFTALGGLYEDNLFLANVDEFLELEPEITAPEAPSSVELPLREGLVCRGVSFQYPSSSDWVLRDVDFQVRPGEVVALVGPNGSGKTTLTKLLCRLYDPQEGEIRLDGTDVRSMDPVELRRLFSFVFQDFARYHVSARDNIRFGDLDHSSDESEIRRAARAAGVDRVIEHLPDGYDTTLGRLFPEGAELSTGEWQKIAIARAFHSQAPLLVVDEPTSALDAHAEVEVTQALSRLFRDRATVVISHRLSTIRLADRIHYMDRGRIIEVGTHDELISRGGAYAGLYRVQADGYLRGSGDEAVARAGN